MTPSGKSRGLDSCFCESVGVTDTYEGDAPAQETCQLHRFNSARQNVCHHVITFLHSDGGCVQNLIVLQPLFKVPLQSKICYS